VSTLTAQARGLAAVLNPVLMDKGLRPFALMVLSIMLMFVGTCLRKRIHVHAQPLWVRWSLYYGLVLALIYLSAYNDVGFVYFQF
jgi:hypothetical protein